MGENDFRKSFSSKPACLAATEMKFSRNSFPVDQYLLLLHSYFRFKSFPKREREREREREKREPRLKRGRGKRESWRSTRGAIVRRARRESRRSTNSAIVRPSIDEQRDRRLRHSSDNRTDLTSDLASPARSHLLLRCAISI